MTSKEKTKTTYLPAGDWYDIFSDERISGQRELTAEYPSYRIPIFIKASSILPLQTQVLSTKEKPSGTLYIHVFYGSIPNQFVYYEDDGATLDYQRGAYYQRTISFDPSAKKIVFSKPEGNYTSRFTKVTLVLHGFGAQAGLLVNGTPVTIQQSVSRILDPLGDLEPLYFDKAQFHALRDKERMLPQKTLTLDNATEIVITWQ